MGSIENVANLVKDIAVASDEQATGVAQVTQGIEQVSTIIQSNTAVSEESASSSEEMSTQAKLLEEQVRRFRQRLQTPLHSLHRLKRMNGGKAFQRRRLLVDGGVVFHGAGAERVEPVVDAVDLLFQLGVMAADVRFRKFRQM